MTEIKRDPKAYKGSYNRLFPAKLSTTSFVTVYSLYLFTKQSEYYGMELIDKINEKFGGRWRPSHGVVYPLLRDLEEEGLVDAYWDGEEGKKTTRVYRVTEKGLEAYKVKLEEHKEMFMDSYNVSAQILNDLYDYDIELQGAK